jgi:citrate lyase subunit beta/citryl-CoA lyase
MRSLLFVPADSPRKIEKALASAADAVILDLEDSVTPAERPLARETVAGVLRVADPATRSRLIVRINPLGGDDWRADLAAAMPAGPHRIMLPKPYSGADVKRLADELSTRESDLGLAAGTTRIIAIVTEVPAALLAMASFVGASPRLEALTWGTEDLSAALGASSARGDTGELSSPFRLARDLTLITAHAAGIGAIDEIEADFRNLARLEATARAAARDGFTGKLAIHPDQVAVINAAFTPPEAELAEAREIVRLFAENPGAGAIRFGSRMIDRPHLLRAERLIARAKR